MTEEDWGSLGGQSDPFRGSEPVRLHHIPKGSMCASCEHMNQNCSHLDFASMMAIESFGDFVVVRCDEFDRKKR